VIALAKLLLVTVATGSAGTPAIAIDPCVDVDVGEVQRLAAIELSSWQTESPVEALSVTVTCEGGAQELRLIDRARGRETVRSVDLSAASGTDRDAKARELALAIAELLRRADVDPGVEPALAPASRPPLKSAERRPPPSTKRVPPGGAAKSGAFRFEIGIAGRGTSWTGGEVLLGGDVAGRAHVGRWLIAELRVGGTKTRPVDLGRGTLDAYGMAAAAGLLLDVTPSWRRAGLAVGARLGGDWLRYAAVDRSGLPYGGRDAGAVSANGAATAFVVLSPPFCVTVDVSAGGALHSIAIRDNGRLISGLRGARLSGAVGVATQF
jgi:hypothetical protein